MEPKNGGKQSLLAWLEARVNLTEILSFLSVFGLLPTELDSRKPVREALREALHQPLPSYARWPRVVGILSFILFIFLVVTGMMQVFYYQPTADLAYQSVTLIARDVTFGTLVHQENPGAGVHRLRDHACRIVQAFRGRLSRVRVPRTFRPARPEGAIIRKPNSRGV